MQQTSVEQVRSSLGLYIDLPLHHESVWQAAGKDRLYQIVDFGQPGMLPGVLLS